MGELGDLPRHLDAGRAGADDDEGEPAPPPLRIRLDLGRLEGAEDAAADLERAVERLQLGRVRLPLVVAEVGVARAAGDDQRVVAEALAPPAVREAVERSPRAGRGRSRSPRPSRTRAFACRLRTARSGVAISAGESAPVATW